MRRVPARLAPVKLIVQLDCSSTRTVSFGSVVPSSVSV
jgi:hypothetical protein